MSTSRIVASTDTDAVNRGFSKQSLHYDEDDRENIVLCDLRQQVYRHVERFLKPGSRILELNAGTGIDALYFASKGHRVHATDLSDGMIGEIQKKIESHAISGRLTCQQVSFEHIDQSEERNFDYVFSNFGGLNCASDLRRVSRHLPALLTDGAYVTWVIMPPVCPWELLSIFTGRWGAAFRRLKKGGVLAHLEGEYFKTHYHSLGEIRSAMGDAFELIRCEGLAAISPPPHRGDFPVRHPGIYKTLRKLDSLVNNVFPFNRCADHLIVTFRKRPAQRVE